MGVLSFVKEYATIIAAIELVVGSAIFYWYLTRVSGNLYLWKHGRLQDGRSKVAKSMFVGAVWFISVPIVLIEMHRLERRLRDEEERDNKHRTKRNSLEAVSR